MMTFLIHCRYKIAPRPHRITSSEWIEGYFLVYAEYFGEAVEKLKDELCDAKDFRNCTVCSE